MELVHTQSNLPVVVPFNKLLLTFLRKYSNNAL